MDGSAHAGEDYVAFDQRVMFNSGTSQTMTIATTKDSVPEPDETFTVTLSQGGGCEVNPNFQYGPPATVTIRDDDTAPTTGQATTEPTGATATTVASSRTTRPASVASPTSSTPSTAVAGYGEVSSGDASSAAAPSSSTSTLPASSKGSGGGALPIVLGGLGLVALGGGAVVLARRRRSPG